MDFMNKKALPFLAVIVVVVIALSFSLSRKSPGEPQTPSGEIPLSGAPAGTPRPSGGDSPKSGTPGAPAPKPAASPSSPTVLSPASGEKWVSGENHDIRWSKAVGRTGAMYLVDAKSGSTVGWIHISLGINQTSFTWNTKDVALSRTNPLKKEIGAGEYVLRLTFDGPVPDIKSGQFSIIHAIQAEIPTGTITIKNFAFTPASLTVKKGDRVTIVNQDSVTRQVQVYNIFSYAIAPGASQTFDTAVLFPGPYPVYFSDYPEVRMTLTVQ
ncbi:hypothetical protein C4571_00635 [Candidatus Parcubacteria bacterium]|nr:MAG: hypothetical protein C4571_00635 [Candidatus Parcubacteria bacterium]